MKLKVIDLFSGCGGFSCGFTTTGKYNIIAGNDIDKDSITAFSINHPSAKAWQGSIVDLDAETSMRELALKRGQLDLLIGGPPCQGFSRNRAFRHKSGRFVDDPRNYLFKEFLRFVRVFLPRAVLIENVPDMIVKEGGKFKIEIAEALEQMGYNFHLANILNAADYGVPQRRKRAILYAGREGSISLPIQTHSNNKQRDTFFPLDDWLTISDAISDLPSLDGGKGSSPGPYSTPPQNSYQKMLREDAKDVTDHVAWKLSSVQSERLSYLQPGAGVESLPQHLVPKSTYGSAYRRMKWDVPSLTITTWMYHPGSGMYYHLEDHRTITIREGARLQSFPDCTVFVGGKVSRCRQVGNAVPPLMASAIADQIYCLLR